MPKYTEEQARAAVAVSRSYSEVLRCLGMRPAGGNHALLKKWVNEIWRIPTDHFDPGAAANRNLNKAAKPLAEILVQGSTYSRGKLKERLFGEGVKERICEMCGQDENWRGRSMSLILDHVNGIPDDNRLVNLRIVCPNCAATLDTHCGRNARRPRRGVDCVGAAVASLPGRLGPGRLRSSPASKGGWRRGSGSATAQWRRQRLPAVRRRCLFCCR